MTETEPLYKVLVDGKSCHRGTYTYDLPVTGDDGAVIPGAWTDPVEDLDICKRGYHVTTDVTKWLKPGCQAYEAETRGLSVQRDDDSPDKRVAASIRLLREAPETIPEWWHATQDFIGAIRDVTFLAPDGNPDPAWKLFTAETWNQARDQARDQAWNRAWNQAWDQARDQARNQARDQARNQAWDQVWDQAWDQVWDQAWDQARGQVCNAENDFALGACMRVVMDRPIPRALRDHVEARVDVWKKGYALLCEANGVLYVYGIEK